MVLVEGNRFLGASLGISVYGGSFQLQARQHLDWKSSLESEIPYF